GSGHDAHELTAIHALDRRGALGKFAGEMLLEARGCGKFVETAPVTGTGEFALRSRRMVKLAFHQRWQPEQLCGGLTFQSCTNFSAVFTPSGPCSDNGRELRLKTSLGSRMCAAGSR